MATFRAYTLDKRGKITWGDWIEADDLEHARVKAHELCDGAHPMVELWQGVNKVDEVECADA